MGSLSVISSSAAHSYLLLYDFKMNSIYCFLIVAMCLRSATTKPPPCDAEEEGVCRRKRSLDEYPDEMEVTIKTVKLDESVVFLTYDCVKTTNSEGIEGFDCMKIGEASQSASEYAECVREVVENVVYSRCTKAGTGEQSLCRSKTLGWFCHPVARQGHSLSEKEFGDLLEGVLLEEELAARWRKCPARKDGSKKEDCLCKELTGFKLEKCQEKARMGRGDT